MSDTDATLARIDTNVRWIMKVGGVVGGLIILLGGVLFTKDYQKSEAIAAMQSDIAVIHALEDCGGSSK